MRGAPILVAGVLAVFTIAVPKLEAQRAGRAGFGGHAALPMGGHAVPGRSLPAVRGFNHGGFDHRPGVSGFRGGVNLGFRGGIDRGFHRDFGRRRFLPFAVIPGPYFLPPIFDYGLPFGFDDDDTQNYGPAYQPQQGPDPEEQGLQMNQAAIADQLQQLRAEMNDLQAARQYGAAPPAAAPPPEAQTSAPPQPPLTIVLRNGQELKVQSYAVMNQTLWDFSAQPVRKIPLSSIDLAASEKATQAAGGEFPALSASQ